MNENNNNSDVLERLFETIKSRQGDSPDKSYTAKLFSKGRGKIACKLVEEATETIVAALYEGDDKVRREGTSGIDEKEARQQK
jgi:phosphoribosyl-ATP pyrophosphohydrolase